MKRHVNDVGDEDNVYCRGVQKLGADITAVRGGADEDRQRIEAVVKEYLDTEEAWQESLNVASDTNIMRGLDLRILASQLRDSGFDALADTAQTLALDWYVRAAEEEDRALFSDAASMAESLDRFEDAINYHLMSKDNIEFGDDALEEAERIAVQRGLTDFYLAHPLAGDVRQELEGQKHELDGFGRDDCGDASEEYIRHMFEDRPVLLAALLADLPHRYATQAEYHEWVASDDCDQEELSDEERAIEISTAQEAARRSWKKAAELSVGFGRYSDAIDYLMSAGCPDEAKQLAGEHSLNEQLEKYG